MSTTIVPADQSVSQSVRQPPNQPDTSRSVGKIIYFCLIVGGNDSPMVATPGGGSPESTRPMKKTKSWSHKKAQILGALQQ